MDRHPTVSLVRHRILPRVASITTIQSLFRTVWYAAMGTYYTAAIGMTFLEDNTPPIASQIRMGAQKEINVARHL
jgi:hypothetical protein